MADAAVISFPHTDLAFAAYLERHLHRCRTPEELEAAVRDWYPRATIVARSRLAAVPGQGAVWYAYRDGSVRRRDEGAWWTAADVPKVAFGRDSIFVEANAEAVALAGGPLLGKPLSTVRPADQQGDPDWLWLTIDRMGSVTSVGRMRRLDGSEIEIEFHAERHTRPGLYASAWRPITVASPRDSAIEAGSALRSSEQRPPSPEPA